MQFEPSRLVDQRGLRALPLSVDSGSGAHGELTGLRCDFEDLSRRFRECEGDSGPTFRDREPPPFYDREDPERTFKPWLRELELWAYDTEVPKAKHGTRFWARRARTTSSKSCRSTLLPTSRPRCQRPSRGRFMAKAVGPRRPLGSTSSAWTRPSGA